MSYAYDAWGNCTTTYHNGGASTRAANNPFTYRGYYYDRDLKLYYLNSRYYDPVVCRFISPDDYSVLTATPAALTDKNLYAYCDNNPVMRVDNSGEFWISALLIGAGATANALSSIASQALINNTVNWGEVGISAVAGGLSGAVSSTGMGVWGSRIINSVISGTEYLMTQAIKGEKSDNMELAISALLGGIFAGEGINSSKLNGLYGQSKQALKTLVSERKILMYASKIRTVKLKIAKSIKGTFVDEIISVFRDFLRSKS